MLHEDRNRALGGKRLTKLLMKRKKHAARVGWDGHGQGRLVGCWSSLANGRWWCVLGFDVRRNRGMNEGRARLRASASTAKAQRYDRSTRSDHFFRRHCCFRARLAIAGPVEWPCSLQRRRVCDVSGNSRGHEPSGVASATIHILKLPQAKPDSSCRPP